MDTTVTPGTVVVGIDGSAGSDRALDWAIDQAVREHRQLTLVHGLGEASAIGAGSTAVDGGAVVEVMREDAAEMLTRARDRVTRLAPEVEVAEVVSAGAPRLLLLALSERAAMVVIGSRGRGPAQSLLLGSVGVAVARHASCPVVVVRPGRRGLVRNGVLVGADGTERSLATVEFAYRQASLRRLPLTIMHCFGADGAGAPEDEVRIVVAEALSGVAEKFPDVRARTELAGGRTDECLLRASRRMDLVVLGAHHGGRMSTLVKGSVTGAVLEHATCPVAIVPSPRDS